MGQKGLAVLLLIVCAQSAAASQVTAALGSIAGIVVAPDRSPVQGARVVLFGGPQTAITNAAGEFELHNLPAGDYDLVAERDLLSADRQRVTVIGGETAHITVSLTFGRVREDLTVTATAGGTAAAFDAFNSVRSLDGVELARARGVTIADALAGEPGVSARSFGANNSRPIIRGFEGDRVLVLEDGIRTGDLSSTSADHQVAIETAGLDRVEVVRGPAALLSGSNAMGGVVNAITLEQTLRGSPFRGTLASVSLDAGSANAMGGVNAAVDRGWGSWLLWGSLGARRAGDYRTPAGTVPNSGVTRYTGKAGAGWNGRTGFASVAAQLEGNEFGIPVIDDDSAVVSRGRRHAVRADVGMRQIKGPFPVVQVSVASIRYRQEETETAGEEVTLGTRFDNDLEVVRAEVQQKAGAPLSGRLGFEWTDRRFAASGEEALAPRTHQRVASLFAYEEAALPWVRIQFGGRLERTGYSPKERAGEVAQHRGPRTFNALSGSAGLNFDLDATTVLVANITRTSRAPALEELYNFGPDAGNGTFEVGNPRLALEGTLGLDLSLRRQSSVVAAELNAFTYSIDNFVFLNVTRETVGALRRAVYVQGHASFVGLESAVDAQLGAGARLRASVSYVKAELTEARQPIPRIPPLSGRLALAFPWRGLTIEPSVVMTTTQSRVFTDETPTDGWATIDIDGVYLVSRQRVTHVITAAAFNLANRSYRMHTSYLKDVAPEMGRGFRVTYTVKLF